MWVLEEILKEIDQKIKDAGKIMVETPRDELDRVANDTAETFIIFGGANRTVSEAERLKVYLCVPHHVDGPEAVHNNADNMLLLRQIGQKEFEKTHSREEFMELIGKNYLEEDYGN